MVYFVVKCIGRFSCRLSRCVVSAEQFTFNFTVSKMAARGHPPPPLKDGSHHLFPKVARKDGHWT